MPGTRLEEKELAARYSVSRTPVREALRQLAASGTVEFRPRHGVFIADLSRHRWREILEVTAEMEAATARYAAERMAETDMQALLAQHRRMKPAIDACNGAEFDKQNVILHGMIHAGAKNAVLFKSIEQLRARSLPYTRAEFMPRKDEVLVSFNEHESVVQAIAGRQPELAFHAMRAHVFRAGLVAQEPEAQDEAA
jgi:DNA-binding GntR family transcriptional regulator